MVSCHISTLRLSKAFYASLSQYFYPSFSHFHFQTVPIPPLPWVFKMQCRSCKRPIVLDCQTHPLQCFQLSKCCHNSRCSFTHRCRYINFHSLANVFIQKVYPKLFHILWDLRSYLVATMTFGCVHARLGFVIFQFAKKQNQFTFVRWKLYCPWGAGRHPNLAGAIL